MGPVSILKSEIERQLMIDLVRAGLSSEGLHFDWSRISKDGLFHVRQVIVQNSVYELQEFESLRLLNVEDTIVAEGSYDFVYSGENQTDPFYIFWQYLEIISNSTETLGLRFTGVIPDHIWDQLSHSNKRNLVNQWENCWANDPKVVAYNAGTAPFDQNVGVGDYVQTSHTIRITSPKTALNSDFRGIAFRREHIDLRKFE